MSAGERKLVRARKLLACVGELLVARKRGAGEVATLLQVVVDEPEFYELLDLRSLRKKREALEAEREQKRQSQEWEERKRIEATAAAAMAAKSKLAPGACDEIDLVPEPPAKRGYREVDSAARKRALRDAVGKDDDDPRDDVDRPFRKQMGHN